MEFLVGILVFVLDIWAIVDIWSHSRSTGAKILWTLLVLIFPVLGVIVYLLLGRGRWASTH